MERQCSATPKNVLTSAPATGETIKEKLAYAPLNESAVPLLAKLDETAPDPWSAADITAELTKPESHLTVAFADGVPVGFACFWLNDNCTDLATVTVDAGARRQGVGEALLRRCFDQLAKAGAKRVLLEVRASNAAAIRLYQKLGFETLATRKNLYSAPAEDGYLMELTLADAASGSQQ